MTVDLLHLKDPPAPPEEWVVGDKQRAAQRAPQWQMSIDARLQALSETAFKAVATGLFSLGITLIERLVVPSWGVGRAIGFVLNTFLYTFYVLDYRYAAQFSAGQTRRTLTEQLTHFEENWVYNFGFGLGTTTVSYLITAWAGSLVSVCVTSVLYAWQVVCSGYAHPRKAPCSLRLFTSWFHCVDGLHRCWPPLWRLVALVALLYLPWMSWKAILVLW